MTSFAFNVSAEVITYKPTKSVTSRGYFISKGAYEDLRLDHRNSKTIRYWSVRKGDLYVEQYFSLGKLDAIKVSEVKGRTVKELLYRRSGESLSLVYARERLPKIYYYSGLFSDEIAKKNACSTKNTATSAIEKLASKFDASVLEDNLDSKIIDTSCKTEMSETELNRMRTAFVQNLSPDSTVLKCLKDDGTAKKLSDGMKANPAFVKEELDLLALKYGLEMGKFLEQPDALKNRIKCQKSPSVDPLASYKDKTEFTFFSPKDPGKTKVPTLSEYTKVAAHETFHSLGLVSEEGISNIIKICFEGASTVSFKSSQADVKAKGLTNAGSGIASGVPISLTTQVMNEEAKKTDVKISKSLAETAVPNPPPAELNQPFVEAAKDVKDYVANPEVAAEKAYLASMNTTAPILKFAEKAISSFSTPALATEGLAVRGPASTSKAAAVNVVSSAASGESDDYKVKEEILLSSEKNKQAKPEEKKAISKANAASVRGNFIPNTNSEVSGSASIEATSASGASVARSGGADPGSSSGADRKPSSIGPVAAYKPSSSSSSTIDRDQITTFLRDYRQAKKKMEEPGFIKALNDNKIKIVDMTGKSLGAAKADIIYLDTGSNYVRQK